jgi:hypothetical protein
MNPYHFAPLLLLLASAVSVGCAADAQERERRLSEGFAAIQVEEATIARASARAAQPDECPVRCGAHAELCQAAERICELADELADADALARCHQARESCDGARPECGCE